MERDEGRESGERLVEAAWSAEDVPAAGFEHEVWERARPVQIKRYWSGDEAPLEKLTEVRVAWCDAALVALFRYKQSGTPVINPQPRLDSKTVGLWERDVCEIFVAPDLSHPERYFEFEAAPTGEWLDLAINWHPSGRRTDWDYASGMSVATREREDEMMIAMRLPWSAFDHRPERNESWRCNLFRCDGPHPTKRYLAWLPTHTPEPQFHVPSIFGHLTFKP